MRKALQLLMVEDVADDADLILLYLRRGGYAVKFQRVQTASAMEAALATPWDVVICDNNLPRFSAVEALEVLHRRQMDIPCLVVSGSGSARDAERAMTAGASDYITKGELVRLVPAVERELREARERREKAQAA